MPSSIGSADTLALPPIVDRSAQVADALLKYVEQSGLTPGDRLPPERELMARLGVGRSTIREVISHFHALGVLEARKGSGTYLLKPVTHDTVHMALSLHAPRLRDVLLQTLQVRRGLEVEASAIAAEVRTDEDLAIIEARLDEMEHVHHTEGSAGKADLAFHLSIYDATHNPLFRQLLEQMREAFERFWDQPFNRPDFARRSFPYHRDLFNAIRDKDALRARAMTLKILEIVEEDSRDMAK